MAKTKPFEENRELYEEWFIRNDAVYKSELKAIRHFIPEQGKGIEIGIGSGLFAKPLGIKDGIEPSEKMRELAIKRGLNVLNGVAEKLPFKDNEYDFALMVTTICFVDSPEKSIAEVYRILKHNSPFILAFVDKESNVGREYLKMKEKSIFYRDAVFFSTDELLSLLSQAGFKNFEIVQTVFGSLDDVENIQDFKPGYGDGSFVVISAKKQ
jgi:SAM-dependent methyltransferase